MSDPIVTGEELAMTLANEMNEKGMLAGGEGSVPLVRDYLKPICIGIAADRANLRCAEEREKNALGQLADMKKRIRNAVMYLTGLGD